MSLSSESVPDGTGFLPSVHAMFFGKKITIARRVRFSRSLRRSDPHGNQQFHIRLINQGSHAAGREGCADSVHGRDCSGPAEATKAVSEPASSIPWQKPSYACAVREDMLNLDG